ncbi:hypothetical protein D3C72_1460480 [compost metagenome]
MACGGQRRFARAEFLARKQLIGHARFLEHGDVARGGFELRVRAKHLERALLAAFVSNTGLGPQRADAIAAVLGQSHHAFLVHGIACRRAIAQHLPHPLELEQRAIRPDAQRGVFLEHPLDGLERHTRRGPRRRVARRDLAGIGKAGAKRRRGLAIHDGHFMTGTGQVPRAGHANNTTAKHKNTHFDDSGPAKE